MGCWFLPKENGNRCFDDRQEYGTLLFTFRHGRWKVIMNLVGHFLRVLLPRSICPQCQTAGFLLVTITGCLRPSQSNLFWMELKVLQCNIMSNRNSLRILLKDEDTMSLNCKSYVVKFSPRRQIGTLNTATVLLRRLKYSVQNRYFRFEDLSCEGDDIFDWGKQHVLKSVLQLVFLRPDWPRILWSGETLHVTNRRL